VRATPAEGYRFRKWTGNLRSQKDTLTLAIDRDMVITAGFAKPTTFPWLWVVGGILAGLAAIAAVVGLTRIRATTA
jgi:hypothetical protein